ncbi:MAG: hypothetical protein P8177_12315 [Gemmatimonadota bacterium]|jgi:hypothetical protein
MTESPAIDHRARLPRALAREAERVRESDPEALNRIVAYGVTRRAIFEHLLERGWLTGREADGAY